VIHKRRYRSHGKLRTIRLYELWRSIRNRCKASRPKDAKYYGAKGIQICVEWDDFDAFRDWAIGAGYRKGLQKDRIDGDYSPENCRFVTPHVQRCNQKRGTLTADDVRAIRQDERPVKVIAQEYGCTTGNIYNIRCGLTWKHV